MTEYARLVMVVDSTSARKATDDLKQLDVQSGKTEQAAGSLASAFKPLAGVFASLGIANFVKDTTLLSSRYGELGIVMEVVGRNAGYSREQLDTLEQALQKVGISAIESRNNIARMISANIDLSKATELARLAQDAAVIGGINSSEAFERLVRGIQSAEVETLRNIGLNVNFEQSYQKMANQLGVTTDQLTELDKVQARTNATLGAAPNIAGAYVASLDNAGKQLRSASRYLEDFRVKLGEAFQPGFEAGVTAYTNTLKFLSENVEGVTQALETGLYVVLARGTSIVATHTAALVAQAAASAASTKAAADKAKLEATSATATLRAAEAEKVLAAQQLERSRAAVTAAQAEVGASRQRQAAEIENLRLVQATIAAENALEQSRFKAQISDTGRQQSVARMAELRTAELAITRQLDAAEKSLAATTVATSGAVQLAYTQRTAAAARYGETVVAVNAAAAASEAASARSAAAATALASSASLAGRATSLLVTSGSRLLGLLGGPLGLALTVGAVALSFIDFSDNAEDAKTSADQLTGSVDRLTSAADRAQARFANLLAGVDKLNKAELALRTKETEDALKRAESDLKRYQRQFEKGNSSVTLGLIEQTKANIEVLSGQLSKLGVERQKNADADTKDGQGYIKRLSEQKALIGAVTEEERLRAQIRAGLLKFSPDEEKRAFAIAREVDALEDSIEADKESARAGKASAEEKQRASEQLLKFYASTEASLQREIALFGETSKAAQLRYDLEHGELSILDSARKQHLISLQEELDKLNQIKEAQQEAEATAEYTAALRDQIDARRNAIDIEVEAIGMGEKQAETLRQLNELEFDYARRLEELARVQGTSAALSAEAYQQRVEALRKAMEEEIKIVEEGEKRKDAARNDALAGARKGFQDYINNAADLAGQFEDLTGSALQGLEDQIVEFVMTGKASFKDLANAILADFVRIGTRQLIAGAASSLLGAFGGDAGGAGGGYKGAFSFDGGGFTGNAPRAGGLDGKGGFLAMLHPQETVVDHAKGQSVGRNSTTIGNVTMVFPDIKTAKEAQQATAVGSRQLAKAIQGFARHT